MNGEVRNAARAEPSLTGRKVLAAVVEEALDETHAGQVVDDRLGGALLVAQVILWQPPGFATRLAPAEVALPTEDGLRGREDVFRALFLGLYHRLGRAAGMTIE